MNLISSIIVISGAQIKIIDVLRPGGNNLSVFQSSVHPGQALSRFQTEVETTSSSRP